MEAETISEDIALIEKREELKRQLAATEYKTLGRSIADWAGQFNQKLTRNPEALPFWYSITLILLLVMVLGLITSILLSEFAVHPESDLFGISVVGFVLVAVFMGEAYFGFFFTSYRKNLLDAMESTTDLIDLQRRLAGIFSVKNQLVFGLGYAVLSGLYSVIFNPTLGFGIGISLRIGDILIGSYLYIVFQILRLIGRLGRYQFKLYAADPSNSEVIDNLANMLNYGVYIYAIVAAIFTLIIASLQGLTPANTIFVVLTTWGPTVVFFVINQYVLTSIITRAKWRTLNGIQTQIETLQAQENILSAETLGHIDKLMDYHDRIRATRNSALNLRASLNFLNSLLLPVIAFVLANLNQIIELIFN